MATFNRTRRQVLQAAGAATLASLFGRAATASAEPVTTLRWGVVGTGGIANSMAGMIRMADATEIGAVSSRRMETAREYGIGHIVAISHPDSRQPGKSFDTFAAISNFSELPDLT